MWRITTHLVVCCISGSMCLSNGGVRNVSSNTSSEGAVATKWLDLDFGVDRDSDEGIGWNFYIGGDKEDADAKYGLNDWLDWSLRNGKRPNNQAKKRKEYAYDAVDDKSKGQSRLVGKKTKQSHQYNAPQEKQSNYNNFYHGNHQNGPSLEKLVYSWSVHQYAESALDCVVIKTSRCENIDEKVECGVQCLDVGLSAGGYCTNKYMCCCSL